MRESGIVRQDVMIPGVGGPFIETTFDFPGASSVVWLEKSPTFRPEPSRRSGLALVSAAVLLAFGSGLTTGLLLLPYVWV